MLLALQFPFAGAKGHNLVHKASSTKTWLAKVRIKLEWSTQTPDLSPNEHHWDKMEHRRHSSPPHLTTVPDLTNALVVK